MLGVFIALENTRGFAGVPATFGHVIVADPLVEPKPVKTQVVVEDLPQFTVLKSPTPGVVPPIVPGAGKEVVAPPRATSVPPIVTRS